MSCPVCNGLPDCPVCSEPFDDEEDDGPDWDTIRDERRDEKQNEQYD
jgi:hypothetical protein